LEIILLTIHGQKPLIGKLFISNFISIGKKKKPNDVISQMKNMRKKTIYPLEYTEGIILLAIGSDI